jgi:hypothetical protein
MLRILFVAAACLPFTSIGRAQDPQGLLNTLIQRQMQQNELQRQNEMMRLQLEQLDLKQQLRFRYATDMQIEQELSRYCPNGEPPCTQTPPNALIQEASRRGLIQYNAGNRSPQQPALGCLTMGDGEGGGVTDCY